MAAHFVLNMQPHPIERFRRFLAGLYETAHLDALLVPLGSSDGTTIEPRIVDNAAELAAADPFAPVMILNSARPALDYQQAHPDRLLGVVMRACELRALTTLHERGAIDMDRIVAIGVDCMGTFGPDELAWRGSPQPLAEEALQFARQGGINPYRYRPACQMCIDPMPNNAAITVDLLGLPARKAIVISSSEQSARDFGLSNLTDGHASSDMVEQHERVRQQVNARRSRARERLLQALNGELAMDVDSLAAHLAECETCQTCLSVCPIFEQFVADLANVTRDETIQWIMACAGCGMCEAACVDHLPLARIINRVKATITEALAERMPANG